MMTSQVLLPICSLVNLGSSACMCTMSYVWNVVNDNITWCKIRPNIAKRDLKVLSIQKETLQKITKSTQQNFTLVHEKGPHTKLCPTKKMDPREMCPVQKWTLGKCTLQNRPCTQNYTLMHRRNPLIKLYPQAQKWTQKLYHTQSCILTKEVRAVGYVFLGSISVQVTFL